jgi:hypothetical protein
MLGAGGFGAIIGWFVYYVNRYRSGEVQFSDLTTLIGVIGGASVLSLFGNEAGGPKGAGVLFGAYGIGLFAGFFGYFVVLIILVAMSKGKFTCTWFLDGRRKKLDADEEIQGTRPTMAAMDVPNDPVPPVAPPPAAPMVIAVNPPALAANLAADTINPTAANIIATCEAQWDANKADCNAFVLAVTGALGVGGLTAPADAITNTITTDPAWRVLADGVEAKQAADAGQLVIGGLKSTEHTPPRANGHVVIVVSGGLAQGKYPTGYWGSLGGTPYKNMTINYAWNAADRDAVHYAARAI